SGVTRESPADRYWDFAMPTYAQYSASVTVQATMSGQTTQNATLQILTRPAQEVLTYDADGNLIGDGQWTYEWDAENRLIRMFTHSTATGWGAPNRELLFTY